MKVGGKFSYFVWALLCILIAASAVSSSVVVRQITERYNGIGPQDFNAIRCMCPNGTTIEKGIDRVTGSEILNGNPSCSLSKDVCKLLRLCKGCILQSESCQSSSKRKDFDCVRDIYFLKDDVFEFDSNDNANASSNHLRIKRNPFACSYPTTLKTADIFCQVQTTKVMCEQTCIIGYTLKQGRKMKYQCRRKENKWKPESFRECEPYVDCTVSLTSGGAADCYTPTTKSPAMCYIECYKYEDKRAVPRRSYTCKKDGKWSRELPFCARAGSNLATVDLPDKV